MRSVTKLYNVKNFGLSHEKPYNPSLRVTMIRINYETTQPVSRKGPYIE